MYLLYYILGFLLIPGILFGAWAQTRVTTTYNKANGLFNSKGLTSEKMARAVLDAAGLQNVGINKVSGNLSDHYNSRKKIIGISEGNYDNSSLAALGVTAHEIGHALQDKEKYFPLMLRKIFIPLTRISSYLLIPLIILEIFVTIPVQIFGFQIGIFAILGVCFYALATILNIITLPVEYNASKRTSAILKDSGLLEEEEYQEVKKVLNAAALTYVAALVMSMLQLLRFVIWVVMIFGKSSKRK